jgi:nucleotide-binding universal stress UspA family protein
MNDGRLTLLLCYDDSKYARHAARELGHLFSDAEVIVLNVWEPVEYAAAVRGANGILPDADELDAEATVEASRIAREGAKLVDAAGLVAHARTVGMSGPIEKLIDHVADDCGADIVVTGARGIGSVHELFSGSLSHHLIQHSDKPVLAIPTPGDD